MGSVKLETMNDGRGLREWDYLSQSEERTILQLIKNRSKVSPIEHPLMFADPILCMYIDLDRLIATAGLSEKERLVVDRLMEGYICKDIADIYALTPQTVDIYLKRAVSKIQKRNNQIWHSVHKIASKDK